MKNNLLLLFLFITVNVSAQKAKPVFQSTMQGGLLEGERGSAFQLQTINGIQYSTWFAGLGAGLDYYHTRSIPVFLNVRKEFFKKEKTPFVYVNGGYHFPWLKEGGEQWYTTETEGGLYYDAGIGYQVPVMRKSAFFFSIGYSQKNIREKQTDGVWITIWPSPPPQTRVFDYNLRRLIIQTGFRF